MRGAANAGRVAVCPRWWPHLPIPRPPTILTQPDERLDKAASAIAELQSRLANARRELSELDSLECERLNCCADVVKQRGFWARLGASVHQGPGRGKAKKFRDVAEVEHRRSLKLMEIFELGEELRRQEMEMRHWEQRVRACLVLLALRRGVGPLLLHHFPAPASSLFLPPAFEHLFSSALLPLPPLTSCAPLRWVSFVSLCRPRSSTTSGRRSSA